MQQEEIRMRNPWLDVSVDDYEAHMALPEVAQTQALSAFMDSAFREFMPESLGVIGCTTGTGFEHIDPVHTRRVVGIDINPVFLDILKTRFQSKLTGLELLEADVSDGKFGIEPVELVFAGLLFEYVDIEKALLNISRSLTFGGHLVAALQLQSKDSAAVTPTPYKSLEILAPVLNLVPPAEFSRVCSEVGLKEIRTENIPLKKGKSFFVGYYEKLPIKS